MANFYKVTDKYNGFTFYTEDLGGLVKKIYPKYKIQEVVDFTNKGVLEAIEAIANDMEVEFSLNENLVIDEEYLDYKIERASL